MTSRGRYRLGFALSATILLAVGGVIWMAESRLENDSAWVRHSHEVLAAYDDLNILHQRALASQRAYLLTANKPFELAFWRARDQALQAADSLKRLLADNPSQEGRAQELAQTLSLRLEVAAGGISARDTGGVEAAQAHIRTMGGPALDEKITQIGGEIREEELRLLDLRKQTSQRSQLELLYSALLGIPLSLLILAIVYRLLSREQASRKEAEGFAASVNWELSRSVAQLEHQSERFRQLASYTGMLQSCSDIGEALEVSRQALSRLLSPSAGTVYLLKASKDHAEAKGGWGEHQARSQALPKPGDCWAMRRNQPYFLEDLEGSILCAHVDPVAGQPAATACIPLSAQGETLGWLYLSAEAKGMPDHLLLQSVAEQMSLALANLRLKEKLKQQSIRDPLTGLFNRRYLEESLDRELSRCQRKNLPLSLLMFDLDHFKAFNDTHGHPGGDALLSAFGQLLASQCRNEDIPCRFGGEEFILILPEMAAGGAAEKAEAIRKAVLELGVRHQGKPLGPVTVSIGVASYPDHAGRASELIEQADEALYRAKTQGRNRVEMGVSA